MLCGETQYTGESPDAPIELRVYPGADGEFSLYEDEGDSYRYEQGNYATIPLRWSDAARTLTVGARTGQFDGMAKERSFHVVLVSEDHGAAAERVKTPDAVIRYTGQPTTIRLGAGR